MQKHILPFGSRIYLPTLGLQTYILTLTSKNICKESLTFRGVGILGWKEIMWHALMPAVFHI